MTSLPGVIVLKLSYSHFLLIPPPLSSPLIPPPLSSPLVPPPLSSPVPPVCSSTFILLRAPFPTCFYYIFLFFHLPFLLLLLPFFFFSSSMVRWCLWKMKTPSLIYHLSESNDVIFLLTISCLTFSSVHRSSVLFLMISGNCDDLNIDALHH